MKKFLIKLAIFSLPILTFVFYVAYDVLILPVDYYTFRAWEALRVYENGPILSGPFYPNMHLTKTEFGDLSGLTKSPVPKNVEWFTDRYGFRKKETEDEKYKVVIIGDSAIAGSALTQDNIFSEVLEDKLGVNVYPYAPADINDFLDDERLRKNPPDLVIIESVEKVVLHLSEITPEDQKIKKGIVLPYSFVTRLAILLDRLKKQAFVNYLYARLEELPKLLMNQKLNSLARQEFRSENFGSDKRQEMVFYSAPEEYFKDWDETHIKRVIFSLKQYQDKFKMTDTKLVFMPIPNKENIYWRQVTGGKKISNLKRLIEAAQKAGIPTVDLWTVYNNLYNQNPDKLLYHTDDSHWNIYGVEVAADEMVKKLNEIN